MFVKNIILTAINFTTYYTSNVRCSHVISLLKLKICLVLISCLLHGQKGKKVSGKAMLVKINK